MSFSLAEMQAWLRVEGIGVDLSGPNALEQSFRSLTFDSRRAAPGILFVGVQGVEQHGADYAARAFAAGSEAVLVEGNRPEGLPAEVPAIAVSDARRALAAAGRGWLRTHRPRILAITGSNGKTTTKDFTAAALGDAVGATPGNLNSGWGLPTAILAQEAGIEALILEMGASAPNEIRRLCEIAPPRTSCITNVAPAHLEEFGSVEAVFDTKAQILDALPPDGLAVLPADDPTCGRMVERAAGRHILRFGKSEGADLCLSRVTQTLAGLELTLDGVEARLPLFGEVNAWNAAAACALARSESVATDLALERIANAHLSAHRGVLQEWAGRIVLDDCYNANPASMRAAIVSLRALPNAGRKIALLGDMAELGSGEAEMHRDLLHTSSDLELLPVGPRMLEAAELLGVAVPPVPAGELGAWLAKNSKPGDAILFKGSRSMRLEATLDAFRQSLRAGEA